MEATSGGASGRWVTGEREGTTGETLQTVICSWQGRSEKWGCAGEKGYVGSIEVWLQKLGDTVEGSGGGGRPLLKQGGGGSGCPRGQLQWRLQ